MEVTCKSWRRSLYTGDNPLGQIDRHGEPASVHEELLPARYRSETAPGRECVLRTQHPYERSAPCHIKGTQCIRRTSIQC